MAAQCVASRLRIRSVARNGRATLARFHARSDSRLCPQSLPHNAACRWARIDPRTVPLAPLADPFGPNVNPFGIIMRLLANILFAPATAAVVASRPTPLPTLFRQFSPVAATLFRLV